MATANKVTKSNHLPSKGNGRFRVYSRQFNELVDVINELEPADGTLVVDTITESTAGAGVTFDDQVIFTEPTTYSLEKGITAFATGGQANAVQLTKEVNIVETVASNGDSVKLPTAVAGLQIVVKNAFGATNILAVYPHVGGDINDGGVNGSINVGPDSIVIFRAIDANTWETPTNMNTDTISEAYAGSGITVDGVLLKDNTVTSTGLNSLTGGITITPTVAEYTVDVAISAAEIVGTSAGSLGHADGVPLVAAPGVGLALQFVNAVLIYDYDTAAYTDGAGDDLTVYINSVAVSPAIATADLITKVGDTVIHLNSLATDFVLGVNSTINLASTAVTNPGTAAGVIRAKVTYRVITTGL